MMRAKETARRARAQKIVAYLKRAYPKPKTELNYRAPFQLVVAVMMSAQCTDKVVNRMTENLFKKYKTPLDFARAKPQVLEREISSVTFYRNKAKAIRAAAPKRGGGFGGRRPHRTHYASRCRL
jgi:endonuclease-3